MLYMIDNIFKGLCQLDLQNNIIYLNELKVELGSEKITFTHPTLLSVFQIIHI